jgi:hypothetical protein
MRADAGRPSASARCARAKMAVRARTGRACWLADEEARIRKIRIPGHAEPFFPHMAPAVPVLGFPPTPVPEAAHDLYAPGGLPPPGFMPGMTSFVSGGPMLAGFPADGGMPMDAAGPDHASALAGGKGKAPLDATEAADLAALYKSIPGDEAALQAACDALQAAHSRPLRVPRGRVGRALQAPGRRGRGWAHVRLPAAHRCRRRRVCGYASRGLYCLFYSLRVANIRSLQQLEQEEPTSAALLAWSNTTSNIVPHPGRACLLHSTSPHLVFMLLYTWLCNMNMFAMSMAAIRHLERTR